MWFGFQKSNPNHDPHTGEFAASGGNADAVFRSLPKNVKPSESVKFMDAKTGASATVQHYPNVANITDVETPKSGRGQGGMSRVLQQIEDHLDARGTPARLSAIPLDDDGDQDKLQNLYARHGFSLVPGAFWAAMSRPAKVV